MDIKRVAMIIGGLAVILAVIAITGFALFRNFVLDSWFTSMQPVVYDGVAVHSVQQFRDSGNTLEIFERPESEVLPDRSRVTKRHLEVEFNGKRLLKGPMPVVPSEKGILKVHHLIEPTPKAADEEEIDTAIMEYEETEGMVVNSGSSAYQRRMSRQPEVFLFAPSETFDETAFDQLVACWKANQEPIQRTLEKSTFKPDGSSAAVPFETRLIHGLVRGNPTPTRVFTSDLPGRYYEGSLEKLYMEPNGRWKIVSVAGPVAAPLEYGIVQIREDGKPYLWTLSRPSQSAESSGVALASHLKSFFDAQGVALLDIFAVDAFKLVRPTAEEELRQHAEELKKLVPNPPPGMELPGGTQPGAAQGQNPAAPNAQPGGVPSLPGYDPRDPMFRDEDPSGLPPESPMRNQQLSPF